MKNKEQIICDECDRTNFKSVKGLNQHKQKAHPYIPPPAPKKVIRSSINKESSHSLLNAKGQLDVGDVFYRVEKLVVKSISETEGDMTIDVVAEVTQQNWQLTKPN